VPEAGAFENKERGSTRGLRPLWSGTLSFGLVSIPVRLFAANRSGGIALRMVDAEGMLLRRRYFCSREERALSADEIERGYEVEKDRFVTLSDTELESLAPKKSREIDLKRFVPVDQIDPVYFERAYFLVPEEGSPKAYRLLARTMEGRGRAGIATFVMRGKEYLVAILGEKGLLRAETLRFHDELRSPGEVGLPAAKALDHKWLERIKTAMTGLTSDALDREALSDRHARRLRELIDRKLETGIDVVPALVADEPEEPEDEESDMVDLMQVLMRSLMEPQERRQTASEDSEGGQGSTSRPAPALAERSKAELYTLAKERHISGRSRMSKQQLVKAIRDAR
jgi:DNA end-binding protein Ku